MKRPRAASGYSLIELMISMAIISIIASIAVPKFANSILVAKEGNTKGAVAGLRGALTLYYGDNEGIAPSCALSANSPELMNDLVPKYIKDIPQIDSGLHPATNNVYCDSMIVAGSVHDGQGWYYDGVQPADGGFGNIWVACDHTDTQGKDWTNF